MRCPLSVHIVPGVKNVIVDYDLVTAYGWSVDSTWKGLLTGTSAIGPCARLRTSAFATSNAATIPDLDHDSEQSLALQMCLPLLERVRPDVPPDTRVILATTVGEIDHLANAVLDGSGRRGAEQSCLARLLREIERVIGVSNDGMVVSAACASSSTAIAEAASLIRLGQHDSVLVVACDAVSEFVFSGFSALGALDPDVARPFDKNRIGLTLGEAAGYVLLMSEQRALREDRPNLGEVAGWGLSSDGCHMTAPSRDGAGLSRAIRNALRSAAVTSDEVACLSAHGTGTLYNDAMEMMALKDAFPNGPLPTYSVKGAVGHTLGAAGMADAIVAVETLRHHVVPPTVGLTEVSRAAAGWPSTSALGFDGGVTVSMNAGFGGVNTALVLRRLAAENRQTRSSLINVHAPPTDAVEEIKVNIELAGAGWIAGTECGAFGAETREPFECLNSMRERLERLSVLPNPIREFGRFDDASKLVCCVAALALEDANLTGEGKFDPFLGIVGSNIEGALDSNIKYYADYLENGRYLARGNLFVYTLASSPVVAAAIHFGCLGPALHVTPSIEDASAPLRCAERLLINEGLPGILVIWWARTDALCVVLRPVMDRQHRSRDRQPSLRDVLALARASTCVRDMARKFATRTARLARE